MARKPMTSDHEWVGAGIPRLDARDASFANRHGRVTLSVDTVVDVIDVYCAVCRRTYDDVAGEACEPAATGNAHLLGGPTTGRKKRRHDHDCRLYACRLDADEAAELRRIAADPTVRYRVS